MTGRAPATSIAVVRSSERARERCGGRPAAAARRPESAGLCAASGARRPAAGPRPTAAARAAARRRGAGARSTRPRSTSRETTVDTELWWVWVRAARSLSDRPGDSASVCSTNSCAPVTPTSSRPRATTRAAPARCAAPRRGRRASRCRPANCMGTHITAHHSRPSRSRIESRACPQRAAAPAARALGPDAHPADLRRPRSSASPPAGSSASTNPAWAPYFHPFSQLFLRLIKMIIAPLIFATLVAGIAGAGHVKVGRPHGPARDHLLRGRHDARAADRPASPST